MTRGLSGRVGTAAAVSALLGCLMLAAVAVGWRLHGGSWAVIETPSMGTAAPVGTLILTRATSIENLALGDVVTYRPANTPERIYTHRVVTVYPDHTLQVRGDVNGAADPLPVRQQDLVGKVVHAWPGVGWLVRALPLLLLGEVVLLVATGVFVPDRWRSSARIVGTCLLVATSALVLRPFVHPVLIAVTETDAGPVASVVSGGVFPTRVVGVPGHDITLMTGQAGTVAVSPTTAGGPYLINGHPDLHGWWLLAVIAVCLLPLVWCLLVGLTPHDPTHEPAPAVDPAEPSAASDADGGHVEPDEPLVDALLGPRAGNG